MFGYKNHFTKFYFSPTTVISHIQHSLILKPIPCTDISFSYFNTAFLFLIIGIASLIGYILARLVNFNIIEVAKDLAFGILVKIYLPVFVILFSLGISKIYSTALASGNIKTTYFYSSLLSQVHLPISIFLSNLEKRRVHYVPIILSMSVQGLISHWMMCKSTGEQPFDFKKTNLIVTSILAHIAFAIAIGGILYRL